MNCSRDLSTGLGTGTGVFTGFGATPCGFGSGGLTGPTMTADFEDGGFAAAVLKVAAAFEGAVDVSAALWTRGT